MCDSHFSGDGRLSVREAELSDEDFPRLLRHEDVVDVVNHLLPDVRSLRGRRRRRSTQGKRGGHIKGRVVHIHILSFMGRYAHSNIIFRNKFLY